MKQGIRSVCMQSRVVALHAATPFTGFQVEVILLDCSKWVCLGQCEAWLPSLVTVFLQTLRYVPGGWVSGTYTTQSMSGASARLRPTDPNPPSPALPHQISAQFHSLVLNPLSATQPTLKPGAHIDASNVCSGLCACPTPDEQRAQGDWGSTCQQQSRGYSQPAHRA